MMNLSRVEFQSQFEVCSSLGRGFYAFEIVHFGKGIKRMRAAGVGPEIRKGDFYEASFLDQKFLGRIEVEERKRAVQWRFAVDDRMRLKICVIRVMRFVSRDRRKVVSNF